MAQSMQSFNTKYVWLGCEIISDWFSGNIDNNYVKTL